MAISLAKGQKISLKKDNGNSLNSFCIGANWGMIESKGFFGGAKKEEVDLDLSAGLFDENKNLAKENIYILVILNHQELVILVMIQVEMLMVMMV